MRESTMDEAEISQIDRRFEDLRLKDKNREKELLSSLLERGIREPLQCVQKPGQGLLLLDGFKRLRCALKLGIERVPVISLGNDESTAIVGLMRAANERGLNILEQSAFIDELNRTQGMSVTEIARYLERSPAWVSVRLGIIAGMSAVVRDAVFSGRLPVRSYMYTLRQFTRVNTIKQRDIDSFVRSVAGRGLSTRAIEMLARGYFKGGQSLKEQIEQGNLDWTLNQLRRQDTDSNREGLGEAEQRVLRDLELAHGCMGRIPYEIQDARLRTPVFFRAAHRIAEGIVNKRDVFKNSIQEFYDDQRGEKKSNRDLV